MPNSARIGAGYRKRSGDRLTFGYPLLRLSVLVARGTRALIGAVFGPEADGETVHAQRLLHKLGAGMLLRTNTRLEALTSSGGPRTAAYRWLSGSPRCSSLDSRRCDLPRHGPMLACS